MAVVGTNELSERDSDIFRQSEELSVQTHAYGLHAMLVAQLAPQHQIPGTYESIFRLELCLLNDDHPEQAEMQILGRQWLQVDSTGAEHEGATAGLGGRPVIVAPGQRVRYQTYCSLATSWGTLQTRLRVQPVIRFSPDAVSVRPFDLALPRLTLRPPAGPERPERV
jgi:uncharacterized protein affecting Mg2+/Co2+ transport